VRQSSTHVPARARDLPVRDTRRLIALLIACGLAGAGAAADIGVHRSVALTGSPEAIWSLIGDFCAIEKWDPGVTKCEISPGVNNRAGAVRVLTLDDGSTMAEDPREQGGSVVEWKSTFQAAPGTDATAARAAIEEIYDAALASLEKQERQR
jgi:Polyketide cyclase / dehydrase and lipid transport